MAPPSLSPDGSVAYVTTDLGEVRALHTATTPPGGNRVAWTFNVSPSGTRVRCQLTHHDANPLGPTVYFQADDGYLYALNAANGQERWKTYIAGHLPTPTPDRPNPPVGVVANHHPETLASPPIVDLNGRVVAATSKGVVWCLNPSNGATVSTTDLRQHYAEPVDLEFEAPLAVGPNGWIYCASRKFEVAPGDWIQIAAGIDLGQPTQSSRIRWVTEVNSHDTDTDAPGVIVGVTADRTCDVYVAEYGHQLIRVAGETGEIRAEWGQLGDGTFILPGKLCTTPALTESGLALIAGSDPRTGNRSPGQNPGLGSKAGLTAIRLAISDERSVLWHWQPPTENLQQPLNFLGTPTVMANGRIYLGDSQGHLWRIDGGQRLLIGGWPTLQQDNRRIGAGEPVLWELQELAAFWGGDPAVNIVRSVDPSGRVLGRSRGWPNYPYNGPVNLDAVWSWGALSMASPNWSSASESTIATANTMGMAVGWSQMSGLNARVWENGVPGQATTLAKPAGFSSAYGVGINEQGDVVGYGSRMIDGVWRTLGIRWEKSGGNWNPSEIQFNDSSIHDALVYGITVGRRIYGKTRFSSSSPYRGFATPTVPSGSAISIGPDADIGSVSGSSEVLGATEEGGFVGWTFHQGFRRAFRSDLPADGSAPGVITASDLVPSLSTTYPESEAYGINSCGQMVGRARNHANQWRAILHEEGWSMPLDLNAWVPGGSGWVLTSAVAISDTGIIAGYGTRNGQTRAWVLRPQP